MFNGKNAIIRELRRDIEVRDSTISSLKSLIERTNTTDRECSVVIDFDKIKVFAIKRQQGSRTIIGYIKPDRTTVGEWYLDCSIAIHNGLVDEFKKHKEEERKQHARMVEEYSRRKKESN